MIMITVWVSMRCLITLQDTNNTNLSSVADPGMFMPDPESRIRIFPSRIQVQKDSGSASENFLPEKLFLALGRMIQDVLSSQIPDADFFPSRIRIQGQKGTILVRIRNTAKLHVIFYPM
jgi:hypothetical protein